MTIPAKKHRQNVVVNMSAEINLINKLSGITNNTPRVVNVNPLTWLLLKLIIILLLC